MSQEDQVAGFMAVTGADEKVAAFHLEAANGDLEVRVITLCSA